MYRFVLFATNKKNKPITNNDEKSQITLWLNKNNFWVQLTGTPAAEADIGWLYVFIPDPLSISAV